MSVIIHGGNSARLVEAAALVMLGAIDVEDAAAQEGVSVADLKGYSTDPRTIRRFYQLRESGGVAAAKAISALEAAVEQISSLIDSGDLPAPVLLKATEVLHRVAGLDDKRKAQKEQSDDARPRATVIINLGPPTLPQEVKEVQGTVERVLEGDDHESR